VDPAPSAPDGLAVKALRLFEPSHPTKLTAKDRFRLYLESTVGPLPIVTQAASAGIFQATDRPPEWGQGGSGYGKRLADGLAYNAVRTTITYGTSSLFREDNRYFASGRAHAGSRILFALSSPFRARTDSGNYRFSISTTSGIVSSAVISRAWEPDSWQGAANIGRSIGYGYAGVAGLNLFREFVPDLIRRIKRGGS
jgi:hypothetical protein